MCSCNIITKPGYQIDNSAIFSNYFKKSLTFKIETAGEKTKFINKINLNTFFFILLRVFSSFEKKEKKTNLTWFSAAFGFKFLWSTWKKWCKKTTKKSFQCTLTSDFPITNSIIFWLSWFVSGLAAQWPIERCIIHRPVHWNQIKKYEKKVNHAVFQFWVHFGVNASECYLCGRFDFNLILRFGYLFSRSKVHLKPKWHSNFRLTPRRAGNGPSSSLQHCNNSFCQTIKSKQPAILFFLRLFARRSDGHVATRKTKADKTTNQLILVFCYRKWRLERRPIRTTWSQFEPTASNERQQDAACLFASLTNESHSLRYVWLAVRRRRIVNWLFPGNTKQEPTFLLGLFVRDLNQKFRITLETPKSHSLTISLDLAATFSLSFNVSTMFSFAFKLSASCRLLWLDLDWTNRTELVNLPVRIIAHFQTNKSLHDCFNMRSVVL